MTNCPPYTDPQTVNPPPYTGWIDPNAPYPMPPLDSFGLFDIPGEPFSSPPEAPLPSTDCDYLIDIDDGTPDDLQPQSLIHLSTRIYMRYIRIRVRREDTQFWNHIRALYHKRMADEATQEMIHWAHTHPQ
jgi:hypothetical protein